MSVTMTVCPCAGSDLHAMSSAKPVILLWCTTCAWANPRIWLTASKVIWKSLLLPLQTCWSLPRRCPVCFEAYQWPHLTTCGGGEGGRGGGEEKAFSLCRNLRHFPLPKITSRPGWAAQGVNRVQHFCKEAGRKTVNGRSWPVSPDARRRRRIPAACGGTAAVAWEEKHRQPPSEIIILPSQGRSKITPIHHICNGEGSPQSQRRKVPSGVRAVALPQTSAKSHHDKWADGSPSVRPSPKAIDYARGRKPWILSEGNRG